MKLYRRRRLPGVCLFPVTKRHFLFYKGYKGAGFTYFRIEKMFFRDKKRIRFEAQQVKGTYILNFEFLRQEMWETNPEQSD